MDVSAEEIYEMILYQTGALKAFCDAEGVECSFSRHDDCRPDT